MIWGVREVGVPRNRKRWGSGVVYYAGVFCFCFVFMVISGWLFWFWLRLFEIPSWTSGPCGIDFSTSSSASAFSS